MPARIPLAPRSMSLIARLRALWSAAPSLSDVRWISSQKLDEGDYRSLRSFGVTHEQAIEVLRRTDSASGYLRSRLMAGASHDECMSIVSLGFPCLDDYSAALDAGYSHDEVVDVCRSGIWSLGLFVLDVASGRSVEAAVDGQRAGDRETPSMSWRGRRRC